MTSSPYSGAPSPSKTEPIPPSSWREIETFEAEAHRVLAGTSPRIFSNRSGCSTAFTVSASRASRCSASISVRWPDGQSSAAGCRVDRPICHRCGPRDDHAAGYPVAFVELTHVSEMMRLLAAVGLYDARGLCQYGPECHCLPGRGFARGIRCDAVYAKTVAYHLLRNPLNQSMPRKFKIALSGCRQDCALTPFTTSACWLPNGRADAGFRMVVGGGLGSTRGWPGAQRLYADGGTVAEHRGGHQVLDTSATGRIVTRRG